MADPDDRPDSSRPCRGARNLHAVGHAVVGASAGSKSDPSGCDRGALLRLGTSSAPATYRSEIAVALGGVAAELVGPGRLSGRGRRDLGAVVEALWLHLMAGMTWPEVPLGACLLPAAPVGRIAAERLGVEVGRGLGQAVGAWCARPRAGRRQG